MVDAARPEPALSNLEAATDAVDHVIQRQTQLREEYGSVLGCPLCSVGSEVGTQEPEIRDKTLEIMERYVKYFESALRDAHAQNGVVAPDAKSKARVLFAYVQGVLAQARIANSLEPLQELKAGVWGSLGIRPALAAA
jgi:TetR/AcrR family transcriptional repressor of nem operon